jgi:UDPglucose 6-dehydrogenase
MRLDSSMKIAIIGYGTVGKAIDGFFQGRADVRISDPANGYIADVQDSNLAFICVPTPTVDGRCDTSIVEEVASWLVAENIVIKSTVEPGTTDRLARKFGKQIVFSPEYVSESFYYNPIMRDIATQSYIVLGGCERACRTVQDILCQFTGPLVKFHICTALEAELIKYFENAFFAVKVGFANEMREICERAGADYHAVRDGWLLDPRINPMHTLAFKESKGYNGKCLPKDREALVSWCERALKYYPPILTMVMEWDLTKEKKKP